MNTKGLNLSRLDKYGMDRRKAMEPYHHEEARAIMQRIWGRHFTKQEFIDLMTCTHDKFVEQCPEMATNQKYGLQHTGRTDAA